jgi:hypothetical protein
LAKPARADLALLQREGESAISTTAGKKAISVRTMAGWAHRIAGDGIDGFPLKRMRSGVDACLSTVMGVPITLWRVRGGGWPDAARSRCAA